MENQYQVDRPLPGPLEELRKDREQDFLIPPPAFLTMEGEFIDLDLAEGWLTTSLRPAGLFDLSFLPHPLNHRRTAPVCLNLSFSYLKN